MCVKHEFDSDGAFKGKVGAEDAMVGKLQNDELLKSRNALFSLIKLKI